MKLVTINATIDPIKGGGTAERTVQLARAWVKEGIDCSILSTNIGLQDAYLSSFKSENLKVYVLPILNKKFYLPIPKLGIVRKLITESDIVHIMGHWTFINAIAYYYAKKLRKPYAVCPAGALPVYDFGRSKMLKKIFNKLVGKAIIRNANFHIAVGDNEYSHYAEYGIPAGKIKIIRNGVTPGDYETADGSAFRNFLGIGDSPYILFMGRINSIKGPDILLDAFIRIKSNFPEMHLVLAGPDGGMTRELKEITARESLESRVHFTGYLEGQMKISAYKAASLLTVPSRQEAMSIVALEAGICGVPVLITDQCGFADLTQIGGGKIVPVTEEDLAAGLCSLLNNRDLLAEMGKRFRAYIFENYTWKASAKSYIKLFKEGLDNA
ncbi:MAG: glycosyltransferase [Clostridiales bacterium]